jgi:tRNA A-37 threonylcarbamoyl transferase component Bud32
VSPEARELELVALGRLGLASRLVVPQPIGPDEPLLEALVKQGALRRHQVIVIRSYIARNKVACRCGTEALAPEGAKRFACLRCGAAVLREPNSGTWTPVAAATVIGVGSRIGPIELVGTLGKGAHGTVYKGRHVQLGRFSAVKVVPSGVLDEHKRIRFQREIEALGRLDHRNIVKVFAAYEIDGTLACDMELATGETLADRLRRVGALPWREATALVAKIARAMAHAHGQGVLHRDLKPANLILREEDGEPLVVDFGLSRFVDQASSFTAEGSILGTPVYMAPEAFSGEAGPSLDIYGLGAILHHALTGSPPFEEASLTALYFKVSAGLCTPTAARGAPASLERVRARAMAVDRRRRYGSAIELSRDLDLVLAGEEIDGPPRVRLGPAVAALFVLTLALVVTAAVLWPTGPERAAVAVALETLTRGAGNRTDALAALVSATRPDSPGHAVLAAELQASVDRAPGAWELRLVRALLAKQRQLPIATEDLAAVASASDAAVDQVAGQALSAGLAGDGGVAAARAVWLAHKDVRAAAVLFACVASGGDRSLRPEVVLALRGGKNDPERARRLLQALGDADDLATLIRDMGPGTLVSGLARRLAETTAALAREPLFPASPGFVLAPLGPAGRAAWHRVLYADAFLSTARGEVLALLDRFSDLPPDLLGTRELFRVVDPEKEIQPHVSYDVLAQGGLALMDEDPLIAAALFDVAATGGTRKTFAHDRALLDKAIGRYELGLQALTEYSRRTKVPAGTERFWALQLWHENAMGLGVACETLADIVPPDERRPFLEKALPARRKAYEVSREDPFLEHWVVKSARPYVRLLFLLDRAAEAEPCIESLGPQATCDCVRAELMRRAGRPGEADALAAVAGAGSESIAVRALAHADEGFREEAQGFLTRLRESEQAGDVSFLEALQSAHVRDYLSQH